MKKKCPFSLVECLLCAKHYATCQEYNNEQNEHSLSSQGVYSLISPSI